MQPRLWEAIIGAIGVGICVSGLVCLAAAMLASRGTPGPASARNWLALFVALLGYHLLGATLEGLGVFERHPIFEGFEQLDWPFLPLALLGYVQSLTHLSETSTADSARIGTASRGLRRFSLAIFADVCLIPFLTLSPSVRLALVSGSTFEKAGAVSVHLMLSAVGVLMFWVMWIWLLGASGWRMWRSLRRHDRWLRSEYSNIEGLDLTWTRVLLAVCLGVVSVTMVDQCVSVAGFPGLPDAAFCGIAGGLAMAFSAVHFHYELQSGRQPSAVPTSAAAEEGLIDPPVADTLTPRYARSAVTEADCQRILAKLDAAMRAGSLWRRPFLSLADLAILSATRPHQISQALNTRRGCNFYDYVNAFRIEEACQKLRSGNASVLEICQDVGFNAKSTFNEAFRRHTGLTPTRFRGGAPLNPTVAGEPSFEPNKS